MLVLVGSIIGFVFLYMTRQNEQKEKLAKLNEEHTLTLLVASVETQEQVRRQIGGDLHDDIGTLLSATRLSLKQMGKHITAGPTKDNYDRTLELLNDALANVRRISKDLMPSTLDEFGLIDALSEFANKLSTSTGINIHFDKMDLHHERFLAKMELIFFRIAQELTNNALKHAQATEINITLTKTPANELKMCVKDNGRGFDLQMVKKDASKGIGLSNMESRLAMINGHINYITAPGQGTQICIAAHIETSLK
jgi:signal transduction histidine kinase